MPKNAKGLIVWYGLNRKWHHLRVLRAMGVKEARDLPWNFGPRSQPPFQQQSKFARRMTTLSSRIFGQPDPSVDSHSLKIVENFSKLPFELDESRARYYPPQPMFVHLTRVMRLAGVFRDEHLDFQEEMARFRALKGHVVPKIGEGKRSALRKQGVPK